jgi:hypothetical protein
MANNNTSMKHRILSGESEEEYNQLHSRWFEEYRPKDDLDATMLERIVQAEWRIARCEQEFAETEAHIGLKPLHEWTDHDEKVILRPPLLQPGAALLHSCPPRSQ